MLIPIQKKFTRSSRSNFSRSSKGFSFSKPKIPYRSLLIIFSVLILFYGVFLLLKYTLFVPEYTITKVDYALSNVQKYDDPYLYKLISTLIKGENYRVIQWHETSLLKQIQAQYPFVETFVVTYKGSNKVFVKLSFEEPKLIVFQGNLRYAVYEKHFFQLFSGNTLGSDALRIELFPSYDSPISSTVSSVSGSVSSGFVLSGSLSTGNQNRGALTGLFYMEPFDVLITKLQLLKETFSNAQYFKYLVGGQRMVIGLPKDLSVYISLPVDIHLQIQNYNHLKKYYTEFAKLREIDLGSIEMDKVIVRK